MKRRQVLSALALGAATSAQLARAQVFGSSERTLRIISGFPAGSALDSVARLIAAPLEEHLGTRVIVEYKTGAGGRIGNAFAKSSKPDGNTVVMCSSSLMAIYPHVFKKLSYDPLKDFVPVTAVCNNEFCFVASSLVPASVKTVNDYLQWAKLDPRNASYGSAAAGAVPHFMGAILSQSSGVALNHVPFNGDAPQVQALSGGQLPFGVVSLPGAMPHLSTGRIRILATSGPQRVLDGVPTIAEAGFKEATYLDYFGFFYPAETPSSHVRQLQLAVSKGLQDPKVVEGFRRLTFTPNGSEPNEFAARVRSDYERWGSVVKKSGFTVEE